MQRRSDYLSFRRDDEMKHELEGQLRGNHPNRAEEWHDPEPSAEDDPEVGVGPVPPWAAGGPQEGEDERLRFELARHLRRAAFPAERQELERILAAEHAPDTLLETVRQLPEDGNSYANVQAVVAALGRKPRA